MNFSGKEVRKKKRTEKTKERNVLNDTRRKRVFSVARQVKKRTKLSRKKKDTVAKITRLTLLLSVCVFVCACALARAGRREEKTFGIRNRNGK